MKSVYICHPFDNYPSGNIRRVTKICTLIKDEVAPLAPHLLLPHYIDEDADRDLALEHCKSLLRGCDEMWICSNTITEGMKMEIDVALDSVMAIRHVADRFKEII